MAELGNGTVFSQTDGSNNSGTVPTWAEGMAPSQVNDSARALQGAMKRDRDHRGPTVTSGGTANAQTLTYSVAPAAYYQGDVYSFIAGATNTSTCTLNVNSLGAKNIFSANAALVGGEIQSGKVYEVAYDGTQFQIVGGPATGKQTIWVPAAAMIARTTNGAASGTTESTTNKVMRRTLDFDASTDEFAQFTVAMPKSWNLGTVTAQFYWGATNTGNVIWGIQGLALSDDDVIDTAFGTAQTVTDGVTATTDLMVSAETSAITIAGTPAAGDLVWFQVYRDADAGGDTCAVDALLLGVKLYFTTAAPSDA